MREYGLTQGTNSHPGRAMVDACGPPAPFSHSLCSPPPPPPPRPHPHPHHPSATSLCSPVPHIHIRHPSTTLTVQLGMLADGVLRRGGGVVEPGHTQCQLGKALLCVCRGGGGSGQTSRGRGRGRGRGQCGEHAGQGSMSMES